MLKFIFFQLKIIAYYQIKCNNFVKKVQKLQYDLIKRILLFGSITKSDDGNRQSYGLYF